MSEQAAGASDNGGEAAAAAGGEGGGAEAQPSSLDKLASSLERFQTETAGRLDALAQRIPEAKAEEEPPPDDGYEFEFDDDDFDDDNNLTPDAVMRMLDERAQQAVQPLLAEFQAAQTAKENAAMFDALEERYTDLQDEAYQDEIAEKYLGFVREIGRPDLAQDPRVFERFYLGEKGLKAGEDEIPAGSEKGVQLERSGAAGAGGEEPDDTEDRIAKAYSGGHHRVTRG